MIAEGTPEEVRRDPRVIAAYLGDDDAPDGGPGSGADGAAGHDAAAGPLAFKTGKKS